MNNENNREIAQALREIASSIWYVGFMLMILSMAQMCSATTGH